MFGILQNQKISCWRVNGGFRVNMTTATYGRWLVPLWPIRSCFRFSPKADCHKYLGFSEHFSPLICPKLTCKYPPKYMFCTLQNRKSSRWRVNWSRWFNISTATYGRGAGPTMTNQKGLPFFTKSRWYLIIWDFLSIFYLWSDLS